MSYLRNLNLAACILHYVLAVVLFGYFTALNNKYKNQPIQGIELTTRDHSLDIVRYNGNCVDGPLTLCDSSGNGLTQGWASTETTSIDIKVIQNLIVAFFLITGTFHLSYYLTDSDPEGEPSWKNNYTRMVANGNNYFRWIEYSITSTIMLFIIAFTSGVKDTNVYYMLFASNVVMISQGQIIEEAVRDGKPWWVPMISSFLLLIFEFLVIARSFFSRLAQVNSFLKDNTTGPLSGITHGATIPNWIKYVLLILFIFYSCFGFLSLIASATGMKYEALESIYLILSLAAKATLGIFVAVGVGQRQQGWKQQ